MALKGKTIRLIPKTIRIPDMRDAFSMRGTFCRGHNGCLVRGFFGQWKCCRMIFIIRGRQKLVRKEGETKNNGGVKLIRDPPASRRGWACRLIRHGSKF